MNRQIVGFKKIRYCTNENVGAGNLSMPEQEMHTTAFWLRFPAPFLGHADGLIAFRKAERTQRPRHGLRRVTSLLLMCDPRDLGLALSEEVSLYLYDNYPGGAGQSAPLYRLSERLLRQTRELIETCACEAGCPACIGAPGETGDRGKDAVLAILRGLSLKEFDNIDVR